MVVSSTLLPIKSIPCSIVLSKDAVLSITQLLDTVHQVVRAIDLGEQTDVAFLDSSKAFDSVSHAHPIRKLGQSGIKGPLLHWFISSS